MIKKNRLLNFQYIIYQNDDWFKFSLDSVLLANFVTLNFKCKKVIDLGAGNCPISMLISLRTKAHITALEYQECIYNLGVRSVKENGLDKQISVINGDVKDVFNSFLADSYDTVVSNPPYFKVENSSFVSLNEVKRNARHEILLSLDDLLLAAFYLLKTGGNFAMIYPTDRFIEVILKMKKVGLEPKKVCFVYSKCDQNSSLFMIEGVKNGNPGLKVLPRLVVHNFDGSYTSKILRYLNDVD